MKCAKGGPFNSKSRDTLVFCRIISQFVNIHRFDTHEGPINGCVLIRNAAISFFVFQKEDSLKENALELCKSALRLLWHSIQLVLPWNWKIKSTLGRILVSISLQLTLYALFVPCTINNKTVPLQIDS